MKLVWIFIGLLLASSVSFADEELPVKVKIGGYLQSDFYLFGKNQSSDNFLIRSATIVTKGQIGDNVSFQVVPDFGQGKIDLIDAYVDLNLDPSFVIRSGKGKVPFGLERLRPVTDTSFVAFGYATQIAPNRDLGLSVYGEQKTLGLSYAFGYFNGVADGASSGSATTPDTDNENQKDLVGRVFWDATKEIGVGLAGSLGSNAISGTLPKFKSPGLNSIFAYSGAQTDGKHSRISPQFTFFSNGFGVLGEYVVSDQRISKTSNGVATNVKNTAYNVEASYALTGEQPTYKGLTPAKNFDLKKGTWGAFEVLTHYGTLDIDNDVFTDGIASAATSVSEAKTLGFGLNWYWNAATRLSLNFETTSFEGGAANGADRADETVISTRVRVKY